MSNRLSQSNSPYLLQHTENPVDWYPWGEEALEKAKREDKPIFLSIGYAACHWCHVMAHESFEDTEIASIMNNYFVNIKVDREERPDIDSIYIDSVVALTGQAGWPLSVFLTPEGKPFYGGTYFPPVPRYNMPSFREVLLSIARSWEQDRDRITSVGNQLTERLKAQRPIESSQESLNPENLEKASMAIAQSYDWKLGGWGRAPKFPQPMVIEFLLIRAAKGDKLALEIASHALNAMARGGMYDVIGGGFARYSTDDQWLIPHFEKMLYDNAQLARVYLYAYLLTGEEKFRNVCEETLTFVSREMTHPEGGFYSSIDADSEGVEGKYYVWTRAEIADILKDTDEFDLFVRAYGVTDEGNFEGVNVLRREVSDEELTDQLHMPLEKVRETLKDACLRLLKAREQRVRPGTDDKVIVSWNALMAVACLEAYCYLGVRGYLDMATRNIEFLVSALYPEDRLLRSWRQGKAQHNAYLEDHAALILACLSLYQSNHESQWYATAEKLTAEMVARFRDPSGGFYDTSHDHEDLISRPKDIQDNATPSGNALAATALLVLSAYNARGEWRDMAEAMLISVQDLLSRHPLGFGKWLCALDFALAPVKEVAILGPLQDPRTKKLFDVLWKKFRPHMVSAISDSPPSKDSPPLLMNRDLQNGLPTAYVCRSFVCQRPVNDPQEFSDQLDAEQIR
jgi:hypothetical protein